MGSNHTGDGFLFDMAIEEADSETVEWLGGQEYYQKWKKNGGNWWRNTLY